MLIKRLNNAQRVVLGITLFVVVSLLSYHFAFARFSEVTFDQVVAQVDAVDNVFAHLEIAAETTATSTILVDKSDTTNFPHLLVGANGIEVAQVRFDWYTNSINATTTTTVKLGLLASSTNAGDLVDVYWFDEVSFAVDRTADVVTDESRQTKILSFSPSVVKLDTSSGLPASFLTNDSSLLTGDYATTTNLLSPNGYINPGVGDLVLQVYEQTGTATTTVSVLYRTR